MSLAKDIKYLVLDMLLSPVLYAVLAFYTWTLRVQFEGTGPVREHLENGGRIVIASWHQRFFGGFFLPRIFRWSPCIMISQSRDGDFIARVVRRIGWIPVRGSSSRGGKEALNVMVRGVVEHRIGGHIVDGPTGPPRVVKPGIVSLARSARAAICPGVVSYEKAWLANSWDRFMIPKPFSRVLFRFGSILDVPETLSEDRFEALRKALEDDLIRAYAAADRHWQEAPGRLSLEGREAP